MHLKKIWRFHSHHPSRRSMTKRKHHAFHLIDWNIIILILFRNKPILARVLGSQA